MLKVFKTLPMKYTIRTPGNTTPTKAIKEKKPHISAQNCNYINIDYYNWDTNRILLHSNVKLTLWRHWKLYKESSIMCRKTAVERAYKSLFFLMACSISVNKIKDRLFNQGLFFERKLNKSYILAKQLIFEFTLLHSEKE